MGDLACKDGWLQYTASMNSLESARRISIGSRLYRHSATFRRVDGLILWQYEGMQSV